MKSHYSEELDDASTPTATATEIVVSEHRILKRSWITETMVVALLVGGVLLLATRADTWSGSSRNDHGIITRFPVGPDGVPERLPRGGISDAREEAMTDQELRRSDRGE